MDKKEEDLSQNIKLYITWTSIMLPSSYQTYQHFLKFEVNSRNIDEMIKILR